MNRFRSKVLWLSLAGALVAFALNSGIINVEMSETAMQIVNTIFTLLVALGILNNPTDSEKF